ncbi:putative F-box/LRR-repeat protein 23 [Capsicum chinense]|nr:putative F-box/LRR-repeat protein 23 [Capsicum chinense]
MEETPAWLELQEGIWENILQRLGVEEILKTARKVCTTWNRICKLPSMWRVINMPNEGEMVYHFEKMCRRAIDHSRGELVDINLQHFADDKLFQYIAQRIGQGNSMTNKGLQAILDSCLHLVCLDLRLCKYVNVNQVLSKRISWQIKDVKHPHDSPEGLEFSFEACGDEDLSDDMSDFDDY